MNRRRKRRLPFAAYAALIFNAALCVTPFMASHVISTAYGDKRPAFAATPEAVTATRQAMDERFQQISTRPDKASRDVWSEMVRTSLDEKEMRRVRGLLLGAPAMLDGKDGEALRARVAVSSGAGEDALIDAAVAYLPEDLQDEYERRTTPLQSIFTASAPASAVPGATPAVAATPAAASLAVSRVEDAPIELNRLGDLPQHTRTAVGWANDDHTDVTSFLLSGIGLILADSEARAGASVAISTFLTRKEGTVPFKLYLQKRIEDAVPVAEMKRLLAAEFANEVGYTPRNAQVVERVFRTTIDKQKLAPLLEEFRILRQIAQDTSTESAVAIISRIKDRGDVNRAQLVARAGGDRVVPLADYDGENLLDTARTTVTWTNALRMQVAGLLACLALLGFVAISVFWKSFTRDKPKKVSAVYLMEDYGAAS
ncbi:MAG TPA: hypothetical protein PK050_13375 [Hyphomonadaceae bacterium]|nr:hypothetical protein [Hyphomonadaceae bacterium]